MEQKIHFENKFAKVVHHTEENFVEVIYAPVKMDDIEAVEELYQEMKHLTDTGKVLCLTDARVAGSMTKEFRDYVAERNKDVIQAVAVWIGSPISRIVGNMFIKFAKLHHPMKLFSDREMAIKWLKEQL